MKVPEYDKVINAYKTYISEIFYIGDLRSGHFCDIPIIPRPTGPSPAPTLCWGGGGGRSGPPIYLGNQQTWGEIQTAMERPGRDISDKV